MLGIRRKNPEMGQRGIHMRRFLLVTSILAAWLALGTAQVGAGMAEGEVIQTRTTIDGETVGTVTYKAFPIGDEEREPIVLLLPTSADGMDQEGFKPVTVQNVEEYLAFIGWSAGELRNQVVKTGMPIRGYLDLFESFEDPQQVEALVALLDGLGQTTNENEYIALSEFLESAGLTANELEQTLQSMGLDMAGLVGALKESRSGFSDLINAYAVSYQDLNSFLNYGETGAILNPNFFPFILAVNLFWTVAPGEVLNFAVEMVIDLIKLLAFNFSSDVKVNAFKGHMLVKETNTMQYFGGTMGQSKMIGWTVPKSEQEPDKLGTNVVFSVRDVYGATLTGQERAGGKWFPHISLNIHQANADNGWVLESGHTQLLTRSEEACYKNNEKYTPPSGKNCKEAGGEEQTRVQTEKVGDNIVPIIYLQASFKSHYTDQPAITKTYLFRLRGDKAPELAEEIGQ